MVRGVPPSSPARRSFSSTSRSRKCSMPDPATSSPASLAWPSRVRQPTAVQNSVGVTSNSSTVRHRSVVIRCTMRFSRSFPPAPSSPAARANSCFAAGLSMIDPFMSTFSQCSVCHGARPLCRVRPGCRSRASRGPAAPTPKSTQVPARHGQGDARDVGGRVGRQEPVVHRSHCRNVPPPLKRRSRSGRTRGYQSASTGA